MATGPATAVELGEIQVESNLGQPLRASIPFALNPDEQMYDFCVRLRPDAGGGLIPTVTRANVSVVGNRIVIVSEAVIRDPLLNMRVAIDCPYTPQISRQYTLIVDPVEFAEANRAVAAQPTNADPVRLAPAPVAEVTPATTQTPAEAAIADAMPAVQLPVAMESEYRVLS